MLRLEIIFVFKFFACVYSTGVGLHVFNTNVSCALNQFCYFNKHVKFGLAFIDFSTLDQLNSSSCTLSTEFVGDISEVDILFPDNTILESDIDTIVKLARVSISSSNPTDPQYITLFNINGIDLSFFKSLRTSSDIYTTFPGVKTYFTFFSSKFSLSSDKVNILTSDKCDGQIYKAIVSAKGENVLGAFQSLAFKSTQFNQRICKFMFQNLSLQEIRMDFKYFNFWPSKDHRQLKLNSRIAKLSLYKMNKLELDERLLDPEVFDQLQILYIEHASVLSIQPDLFKAPHFPNFKSIEFYELINLRGLFHSREGVTWIKYLNYDVHSVVFPKLPLTNRDQDMLETYLKLYVSLYFDIVVSEEIYPVKFFPYLIYEFPDEDFCLFHDIPVERLVFPQILGTFSNFSCTYQWLYRYGYLYPLFGLNNPLGVNASSDCNFISLYEKCQTKTASNVYAQDPYFALFFMSQGLKQAKKILFTYVGPVFSAFGFVTNMLIVLTIAYNHKRRREIRSQLKESKDKESILLEETLYKYILINSVLNSIYLLIYLFYYSITCTTTIVKKIVVFFYAYQSGDCFTRNIFISILGNILKMTSNASLLQISLNRYVLVGKDHAEWLVKLSQLKLKVFFICSLSFSVVLATVIYFQKSLLVFESNEDVNQTVNNVYYTPYYYKYFHFDTYFGYDGSSARISQLPLITAFTLVHDIFSYFLFCTVSILLDIMTVRQLHHALRDKKKLLHDKSEHKKCKESERRSIIMVILRSLVNMVFRAPELVSMIFYYVITQDGGHAFRMLCMTYASCLVFIDYADIFYILSLCFSFFFYIKFNMVFYQSYKVLAQSVLKLFC